MSEVHRHPDPNELAALYVSGALTSDEAAEVERSAQADPRLAQALREAAPLAEALLSLVQPVHPPAHLRDALLGRIAGQPINGAAPPNAAAGPQSASTAPSWGAADPRPQSSHESGQNPQVWKQWASTGAGPALYTLRSGATPWEPTGIDGIEIRRLFVDRDRNQTTMMIRMAAGRSYPRHVHGGAEECLVLQGDLHVGDTVLHAGDYQRAAEGSLHGVQSTEQGCLLLIVSSLTDELV